MTALALDNARAGLQELAELARRHGHALELAGACWPAAASGRVGMHELPNGLRLYHADVALPGAHTMQARYGSSFVVSLCIDGAVDGTMPDGTPFSHRAGRLGAFHAPAGGAWTLRTGPRGTRWSSVAVEVPADAWAAYLPDRGGAPHADLPLTGAALVAAEPWLLALAAAVCQGRQVDPAGDDAAVATLHLQALALSLWTAGLRALAPAAIASVVGLQGARERRAVAQVRELVDAEPEAAWTLDSLARRVGLPPRRLGALFRAVHGTGAMDYLQQQRLNLARRLIEQGRSVTEACFDAGYGHTASFSRAYRRAFGHCPRHTPR
jgi:AraC-like DNA-binding protein